MTEKDGGSHEMGEVLDAWTPYARAIADWEKLVEGIEPKPTGCGPVYELDSPLAERSPEKFAIADMRDLLVAQPHYHSNGETEIYFVLSGTGLVVVGGQEINVHKGSIVVTPPNTAHFTISKKDLVLGIVNTPTFKPENYVPVEESSLDLGFENAQLSRLVEAAYLRRGYTTVRGVDDPGTIYWPRKHPRTHLYTIAGSLEIRIGDKPLQILGPHEEVIIEEGEVTESIVGGFGWDSVVAEEI